MPILYSRGQLSVSNSTKQGKQLTLRSNGTAVKIPSEHNKIQESRSSHRIRLVLVSSGLGNVTRGFEISTARWYHALKNHTELDVHLICGGPFNAATVVPNIGRNNMLLRPLMKLPFVPEQRRWELSYGIEQFSFLPGVLIQLARLKPDVVWVKDVPLAQLLLGARSLPFLDYKIVFANGASFNPANYQGFDHIQQLQPDAYRQAKLFGISENKMDLISNCIDPDAFKALEEPSVVRDRLGIGQSDWMIVCAAAWNKYHKRIDYLIEEVARIDDPSVKLVLCGVPEADTSELKELGKRLLGDRISWITLPSNEVPSVIKAADVFVLPSLSEGLGNVLIEAALAETPVVSHPHSGAHFILQDPYWMTDMTKKGALASRVKELRMMPPSVERCKELATSVQRRFSDKTLAQQFELMIEETVKQPSYNIGFAR